MTKVAVLMSTYNGQQFIREQIESIFAQENVTVELFVRDDGSSDDTTKILEEYGKENKLHWYTGKNLRAAKSFMDLIEKTETEADYIALSDQDDVWMKDKLGCAVSELEKCNSSKPAMYYSNTLLVDRDLNVLKQPKVTYVSNTMKKSVISSGCTGCTLCMNRKLFEIVKAHHMEFEMIHDMWIHKICLAVDGQVIYDYNPHILYRQHGNNVIGGESSLLKRIKRHYNTLFSRQCYRSSCSNALYDTYKDYMQNQNKEICEQILHYHEGLNRFRIIFDSDYRLGDKRLDLLFIISVLLGVF